MSQAVQCTFATGQQAAAGALQFISDALVIPTGTTTARLTTIGVGASTQVKTQKITAPGTAWVDQTTYSSDQANLGITVAAGEQWRVVNAGTWPALTAASIKLSAES